MLLKPLLKSIRVGIPLAQYPLTLFANGEQGIWLDPSDISTLFQDAAGTIPVALDGDPVGLVLDKSGNDNHASQSIPGSRPKYRTDGILHWLEFDGIDDGLIASVPDFTGDAVLILGSGRGLSSRSSTLSIANKTSAANSIGVGFEGSGLARSWIFTEPEYFLPSTVSISDQRAVLSGVYENGSGFIRVNGLSEGDTVTAPVTGANRLGLGVLDRNAPVYYSGSIYSAIVVYGVLTDASERLAERYSARKTGTYL